MTALSDLRWVDVPCPLCAEDRPRTLARVGRYEVELTVVQCGGCGHVYLSPRPADDDLPRLYDEEYYAGSGRVGAYTYADDREDEQVGALRARARLMRIERLAPPGRLLEVGCAFGAFLLEARRRGWEVRGVDLSPYAVEACAGRDVPVDRGTLEDAPLDPESLDVIYLSETVEHLPDPRTTVRAASRALRRGGLIVLGTANHASLARLLRGRRWGYYMPGHLQYFTAGSLSRLLADEGLPVVRRRFGDDRSLAALREIRRAQGGGAGLISTARDL
ncbi:MAG: class I SAM-dependent methyltransferase, partial [Planctomycetota bacterium]